MASISDAPHSLLYSRIDDTVRLCDKRGAPCFLGFLDQGEQAAASAYLAKRAVDWTLFGGYDEAERCLLAVYPAYAPPQVDDYPLCALGFRYRAVASITHRDVLGTLMAAGLRRDAVGDILCGAGLSVVFLRAEMAPFVTQQVRCIGGEGVTLIPDYAGALPVAHTYQEIQDTVASPRLDAILKVLLRQSREKAARAVADGAVSVNHTPVLSGSMALCAPCTVSVRGYGRFLIDRIGPATKKGRLMLYARKCL